MSQTLLALLHFSLSVSTAEAARATFGISAERCKGDGLTLAALALLAHTGCPKKHSRFFNPTVVSFKSYERFLVAKWWSTTP